MAVVYIMHIACLYDVLMQNGLTALHICIFRGHLNVMRTLVKEFHLDPDVVDKVSIMLCHMCVYLYVSLLCILEYMCVLGYMISTTAL